MPASLPTWFRITAHAVPWLLCIYFLTITLFDPQLMHLYLSKDHVAGGGLVENLTVIFLLPGIIAGLYAFTLQRRLMQPGWAAYWLLAWILACIYFAGEEISWGQWYFGWDTPEAFSRINDQNEMNLHNTSTWFDQKPRALVELWIFLGGLLLPVYRHFQRPMEKQRWDYWINPVGSLVSAALFFTLVRFAGWINDPDINNLFGSSELREMCVAVFLSLFLLSYPARLAQLRKI